jgi:hypothetical protein
MQRHMDPGAGNGPPVVSFWSSFVRTRLKRLVLSSPNGPFQNEGELWRPSDRETHDEAADFRNGRDERNFARQAAIDGFGLLSFGLPNAERRKSALSQVRNCRFAFNRKIQPSTVSMT